MDEIFSFVSKAMHLKRVDRSGWNKDVEKDGKRYYCKVEDPESSVEHSWSAMLLYLLIYLKTHKPENIDWEEFCKGLITLLIHDIPEYKNGDPMTPFLTEEEVEQKENKEWNVFLDMCSDLPEHIRLLLTGLMETYIQKSTTIAKDCKDADLIDPILQGLLYQKDPNNILDVCEFVETNLPKVKNPVLSRALSFYLEKNIFSR